MIIERSLFWFFHCGRVWRARPIWNETTHDKWYENAQVSYDDYIYPMREEIKAWLETNLPKQYWCEDGHIVKTSEPHYTWMRPIYFKSLASAMMFKMAWADG